MNQRHQDLIAKVNAGTLTADQANRYSETLKPVDPEAGTAGSGHYHCECGQCTGNGDSSLVLVDGPFGTPDMPANPLAHTRVHESLDVQLARIEAKLDLLLAATHAPSVTTSTHAELVSRVNTGEIDCDAAVSSDLENGATGYLELTWDGTWFVCGCEGCQ